MSLLFIFLIQAPLALAKQPVFAVELYSQLQKKEKVFVDSCALDSGGRRGRVNPVFRELSVLTPSGLVKAKLENEIDHQYPGCKKKIPRKLRQYSAPDVKNPIIAVSDHSVKFKHIDPKLLKKKPLDDALVVKLMAKYEPIGKRIKKSYSKNRWKKACKRKSYDRFDEITCQPKQIDFAALLIDGKVVRISTAGRERPPFVRILGELSVHGESVFLMKVGVKNNEFFAFAHLEGRIGLVRLIQCYLPKAC